MGSEIVFVGGCIVDLVSYAPRFPLPGETLIGSKFCKNFGGKGCNQCVMSAHLGTKTAMIAKVGDDSFGHEFLVHLKQLNINTDHVSVTSDGGTSTATITVIDSGENNIVNVFGAISYLSVDDIYKASQELIPSAKLLVCSMECPKETLIATLVSAKKNKVQTMLNAAPCSWKLDHEIFSRCDILCVNEVEASILTELAVSSVEDAEVAAQALQKMGSPIIIVTLGDKGALLLQDKNAKAIHVSCPKVKAIDTTGAGDAFVGSLAHFLVARPDLSLQEIVRRSCAISSISVQGEGTQASFPKRDQVPKDLLA